MQQLRSIYLFFWTILVLPFLGSILPPSAAAEDPAPDAVKQERDVRSIEGWTVYISRELLEQDAKALEGALELLEQQLATIKKVVPEAAVPQLQEVPLWVSPEYPGFGPKAEYHPAKEWLQQHGRDPQMAKAVEFTNVSIFSAECRRMPLFVLHELAHAYHDRILGYEHSGIRAAYERAKASGRYDRVERRDAEGRRTFDRAYALANPQEYFAECTEAYFGTNDFSPYTRDELHVHDPEMCQLLGKLWGVNSAQ